MSDSSLINKICEPCKGGITALSEEKIKKFLKTLGNGWHLNDKNHLYKEYVFKNFKDVLIFTNKIGDIADKEGHHPDLKISWGLCCVEIWTHKFNGLTENDFILAAKIEGAP